MVKATLKVDSAALSEAMRILKSQGGGYALAGVFKEARSASKGTPLSPIAFFHEFGTSSIPQRSFLRSTANEQRERWAKMFIAAVRGKVLTDRNIIRVALGRVADRMAGDIRDKIDSNIPPALKPETIKAKIKGKGGAVNSPELALVQTGEMQSAVTGKVVDG